RRAHARNRGDGRRSDQGDRRGADQGPRGMCGLWPDLHLGSQRPPVPERAPPDARGAGGGLGWQLEPASDFPSSPRP
ncbi:hypothetical protein QU38_02800, partial [Staphylococcus aureus]